MLDTADIVRDAIFHQFALDGTRGAGVQLHRGSTLVCTRQTRVLVCGLALFLIPAPSFGKALKYHRRVPIDSDLVRGGQYCGAILVHLESGDFFEGLEVRKTQAGQQFLKGSQAVALFPRELNVIVRVVTSRCVGPPDPRQFQPDFSFDMKFVSSLRFEGFWQRGLERRNLDLGLFSSGESGTDSFENDLSTNAWEYVLRIKCLDVPLTDTLVIQILSADGKRVSRISGRLGRKMK